MAWPICWLFKSWAHQEMIFDAYLFMYVIPFTSCEHQPWLKSMDRQSAYWYEMEEAEDWRGDVTKQAKELYMQQDAMTSMKTSLIKQGDGVYVMASTFTSLAYLVHSLTSPEVNIPVSAFGVGPVTPGDITKASKPLLHKKPQFATVLALQVELTPQASQLAHTLGVKVICADSKERLSQQFNDYVQELGTLKDAESHEAESDEVVFPTCVLCMLPKSVLNKEDPIVVGVFVVEGLVRVGTPLCVPYRAFINVGRVAWIEKDQQPVDLARQGEKVIIKIVAADPKTQQFMLGREFDVGDVLVSRISRRSIYHFILS